MFKIEPRKCFCVLRVVVVLVVVVVFWFSRAQPCYVRMTHQEIRIQYIGMNALSPYINNEYNRFMSMSFFFPWAHHPSAIFALYVLGCLLKHFIWMCSFHALLAVSALKRIYAIIATSFWVSVYFFTTRLWRIYVYIEWRKRTSRRKENERYSALSIIRSHIAIAKWISLFSSKARTMDRASNQCAKKDFYIIKFELHLFRMENHWHRHILNSYML